MTFGISLTDGLYVTAICCSFTSVYFKLQWSLYRCIRRYWVNVEAGDTRRGQRGGDLYETGHPKWKVKIGEDVQRKIEEPRVDKKYQKTMISFNKLELGIVMLGAGSLLHWIKSMSLLGLKSNFFQFITNHPRRWTFFKSFHGFHGVSRSFHCFLRFLHGF